MKTITDVKDDLINHLFLIDKTKLNMMDLKTYSEIVKIVDGLSKPGEVDFFKETLETMKTLGSGFGGNYKPVEMKEGK